MNATKPQKQILRHRFDCGKESISSSFIRFYERFEG